MPYLHLPIQSGSNKILKEMNRNYTREEYIKIIENLKIARPDIALTSDFIVGFPGESEKDFDDTMDVIKLLGFAGSYSFKYSPRPGTPASLIRNTVDERVSDKRLKIIQTELAKQQKDFNNSFLGKKLSVLIEKVGKKKNQYVGRSEYLQPIHLISNDSLVSKIVDVKIESITAYSLHGKIN